MIPKATMTLLAEVLDERAKQIAKGYTPEHDDAHQRGELAQAAAWKIMMAIELHGAELSVTPPRGFPGSAAVPWPWPDDEGRVPVPPVRRGYIVAITMLLAEVERLDRLREAGELEYCGGCGALVWKDDAVVDVEGVVLCPLCAEENGREIAYAHEPNSVARFLRERCDRNPEASETAADLYAAYRDWYDGQHEASEKHVRTQMAFGLTLRELPWITGVRAFGSMHWKGLSLRREG